MSEEKQNRASGKDSEKDEGFGHVETASEEKTEDKYLDIAINRSADELIIKDPETGKGIRLRAKITQIDDEEIKPLTSDEFRTALERIDALGLTWTADRVPHVTPKESVSDEVFLRDEFEDIQKTYPALPVELSSIVNQILTGKQAPAEIVGSQDDLKEKVAILNERGFISPSYRSDFFFKHATKVPYLTDIDWEVVLKLAEKNVEEMPSITYALLSLKFLDPSHVSAHQRERSLTVAVDEKLAQRLIDVLTQVKKALHATRRISEALMQENALNGGDNANDTNKEHEQLE